MKRILHLLLIFSMLLLTACFPLEDETDNGNKQDDPIDETDDNEYQYIQSKILKIDRENNEIEFLNYGTVKLDDEVKIAQYINQEIKEISLDDLYVGLENIYLQVNEEMNNIKAILLDGEIFFRNIRVAIRKDINNIADLSTLYHQEVELTLNSNYRIRTVDNDFSVIAQNKKVVIIFEDNEMVVTLGNEEILRTSKRVVIAPISASATITFNSITRAGGRTPSYYGSFEVVIENNKLLVINDVFMEDYLPFVVPSEMPSSFGPQALRAQAVAARTYAYGDILNRGYEHLGYAVDDSTMSQVYNNSNENPATTSAVKDTSSYVMLSNGDPINAFYYSTSSGITASGHEVWITDPELPEPIPYLMGQNLTTDLEGNKVEFDPTSEDSMLEFFKNLNIKTPDNISYQRWKVELTKTQIRTIYNNTLKDLYKQYPNLILTKVENEFVSQEIPEDIGEVLDIVVSKRGESGVVISLDIITSKTTYRVINQYNIRFTLRPHVTFAGETIRYQFVNPGQGTYSDLTNPPSSALLSGFFAIERVNGKIVLYGGGFGHGVGMSQYGARGLASQGKTFEEILTAYYNNMDLVELKYTYSPLGSTVSEVFKLMK